MWAYFDSSALAKRYLDEAGRSDVMRLLRRYDVVTSAVVGVELRSARRRVPAIPTRSVFWRFAPGRARVGSGPIGEPQMLSAGSVGRSASARALDVHVASAQLFASLIRDQRCS